MSKYFNFGAIIPIDKTYFDKLPSEIVKKIQKPVSAYDIQLRYRFYHTNAKIYLRKLLTSYWDTYDYKIENAKIKQYRKTNPWLILKITEQYTVEWIILAAKILQKNDLKKGSFWFNCIKHIVIMYTEMDPDRNNHLMSPQQINNVMFIGEWLEVIFEKMGYKINTDNECWYFEAIKLINKNK
jgi:hypothetical protein